MKDKLERLANWTYSKGLTPLRGKEMVTPKDVATERLKKQKGRVFESVLGAGRGSLELPGEDWEVCPECGIKCILNGEHLGTVRADEPQPCSRAV